MSNQSFIMMERAAVISKCGTYMYELHRYWDNRKPTCMFLMLNPSTADGYFDDATVKRCIGFADSWGYGGFVVCNLFAYRATKPKDLLLADDPFGDANLWHIRQCINKVDVVVCAWGNDSTVKRIMKGQNVFELLQFALPKLHYIRLNANNTPAHPLFLPKKLRLKKFDFNDIPTTCAVTVNCREGKVTRAEAANTGRPCSGQTRRSGDQMPDTDNSACGCKARSYSKI